MRSVLVEVWVMFKLLFLFLFLIVNRHTQQNTGRNKYLRFEVPTFTCGAPIILKWMMGLFGVCHP